MNANHDDPLGRCLLRGSDDVASAGVFVTGPGQVHRFGGVPGKRRNIFYALCRAYFMLPGREGKVETAIEEMVNGAIEAASMAGARCFSCGSSRPDMAHTFLADRTVFFTCPDCREKTKLFSVYRFGQRKRLNKLIALGNCN